MQIVCNSTIVLTSPFVIRHLFMPLLDNVTKRSLHDIGNAVIKSLMITQCEYLTTVVVERLEFKQFNSDCNGRELEIAEYVLNSIDDTFKFETLQNIVLQWVYITNILYPMHVFVLFKSIVWSFTSVFPLLHRTLTNYFHRDHEQCCSIIAALLVKYWRVMYTVANTEIFNYADFNLTANMFLDA